MIRNLIIGLQILLPHYKNPDGFNLTADNEVIYAFNTELELSENNIMLMISLGWHQDCDEEEFLLGSYNQEQSWIYYT